MNKPVRTFELAARGILENNKQLRYNRQHLKFRISSF
jgi:hypothetical protein